MSEYDEKDWGIEIERCDDGDLLLRQGDCCGCGDDVAIRLHRCHFPLIAKYLDLVTQEHFENASEQLRDRLSLLGSLVRAHTKPGEPLRLVIDAMDDATSKPHSGPTIASGDSFRDACLPASSGCAGGPSERDLFEEGAAK